MDVLMIILGVVVFLIYVRICGSQRRPLKAMAANSAAGIIMLVLAAVVTGFFGRGISVDYITVFTASVLGVPGAVMIMLIVFVI